MAREQRRFDRAAHSVPLQCRRLEDRLERRTEGATINVSAVGLVMQTRALFDVGATVELSITLSETIDPLLLRGRIVWSKPGGLTQYGVEFLDVTPAQQAGIDELVQFLNKRVSS